MQRVEVQNSQWSLGKHSRYRVGVGVVISSLVVIIQGVETDDDSQWVNQYVVFSVVVLVNVPYPGTECFKKDWLSRILALKSHSKDLGISPNICTERCRYYYTVRISRRR